MTEDNFEAELAEILKDVPEVPIWPQLPLVFTGRDGESRQIGIVELHADGTCVGMVYAGAEGALRHLFNMPLAFHIDGNVKFSQD